MSQNQMREKGMWKEGGGGHIIKDHFLPSTTPHSPTPHPTPPQHDQRLRQTAGFEKSNLRGSGRAGDARCSWPSKGTFTVTNQTFPTELNSHG